MRAEVRRPSEHNRYGLDFFILILGRSQWTTHVYGEAVGRQRMQTHTHVQQFTIHALSVCVNPCTQYNIGKREREWEGGMERERQRGGEERGGGGGGAGRERGRERDS